MEAGAAVVQLGELVSALYRFHVDVSDVDRSVYESLDVRLVQHPSESLPYLLTRLLAYCLNVEPALALSAEGLCNPDEPAMSSDHPRGGKDLWIEIGNPSARRLHKAAKAARRVKVYTYKNAAALLTELNGEDVHEKQRIEIYSFDDEFLSELESLLSRTNSWTFLHDAGSLVVGAGEHSVQGQLHRHPVG